VEAVVEAVELAPGVNYTGGMRVKSTALGFTFTIPDGWSGSIPAGAEALILVSGTVPGMVLALGQQNVTAQEVIAAMTEPFPVDQTTILYPAVQPQVQGEWIIGRYQGTNGTTPQIGYTMSYIDETGSGILYFAAGPLDQADYYAELLTLLGDSTDTDPVAATVADTGSAVAPGATGATGALSLEAQEWQAYFAGQLLTYMSTYDSDSVGSSTTRKMYLCSNG
jgi:hypothetical protein